MKNIVIIIILLSASCTPKFKKVKFVNYTNSLNNKKTSYIATIPLGYKADIYMVESEGLQENHYLYADSSMIYLSNFEPTPNYKNLTKEDQSKIFGYYINDYSDTLIFKGRSESGFYWKEIKIKDVSFGYANVPINKKEKFDKVLSKIYIRR